MAKKKEININRLVELMVEEVSVVPKGANRKPLIIKKNDQSDDLENKDINDMKIKNKEKTDIEKEEQQKEDTKEQPTEKEDTKEQPTEKEDTKEEQQKEDTKEEQQKEEDTEDTKKEDTANAEKASSDMAGLLSSAIAQIQPGKPVEESVVKLLQRVKAMIPQQASPDKAKVEESKKEDSIADEKTKTEKSGKKMAKTRRQKFDKAISQLKDGLSLLTQAFKEVVPEKERGLWKSNLNDETIKKMDKAVIEKQEKVTKIAKQLGDLTSEIEKKKSELKGIKSQIAKEMKRPRHTNTLPIDGVSKEEKGFRWKADLNETDDD
jgi:hypothetical protein